MLSRTPPAQGEALPPPTSPAEEAARIAKNFLSDLPTALEAAEHLIGVESGPLTAAEAQTGLMRMKLGTGAYFFETYDPTVEHAKARTSGRPTVDNVRRAALHARNTLYIAPGIWQEFNGYPEPEGLPAGLVVLGRDDERPDALCAYLYTTPDYTSDPHSSGHTRLKSLLYDRGYAADHNNSRLQQWVDQNAGGDLAEATQVLNNLLSINERQYAEELLGIAPSDKTVQPVTRARTEIAAAPHGLLEHYRTSIDQIAPDVPESIRHAAATILATSTGRHEVKDDPIISTGSQLPVLAGDTAASSGTTESGAQASAFPEGNRTGKHRSPTASGAHTQTDATESDRGAGQFPTTQPRRHLPGRPVSTPAIDPVVAAHIRDRMRGLLNKHPAPLDN